MASMPTRIVIGALLLCVPAALATLAAPRFVEGLRIAPVQSVAVAVTVGDVLPVSHYRAAADEFGNAPVEDGADHAWQAVFLALSTGTDATSLQRTRAAAMQALVHAPLDTSAWTVLCEKEALFSNARAVACLDKGFPLMRYDWFTARNHLFSVANQWPYLDERLRDSAVKLILPMWRSPQWENGSTLRYVLLDLSNTPDGRQLLLAGLAPNRDELRAFNRWVILERINNGG